VATKASRPGRILIVFGLVILALYGGAAAAGQWKPRLGLDLQGGTRITLQAKDLEGGSAPQDKLDEAKDIIEQRVNGTGVSEAEVSTQGGDQIVVEIPGKQRQDLVEQVGRTAQLRFRLVWDSVQGQGPGPQVPPAPIITLPPETTPTGPPSGDATSTKDSSKNRAVSGWMRAAKPGGGGKPGDKPSDKPSDQPTDKPSGQPSDQPTDKPSGQPSDQPTDQPTDQPGGSADPAEVDWSALTLDESIGGSLQGTLPDPYQPALDTLRQQMADLQCPASGAPAQVEDVPGQPLVTCDVDGSGTKYVLSPAVIEGTHLDDAQATIPTQSIQWIVTLSLDGDGGDTFATVTRELVNTAAQFAIVLDGQVLSAPQVTGVITDGNAQIEGGFTQQSATSLANSLKYGALPLAFEVNGVEVQGPSLAGSQLNAGILAGVFGLALVVAYCMVYYRGLGLVIVASLGVAGAMTYALILLLGAGLSFTLTLPGIAGLIVAIGITADSFIVFFERLRDEVRDGKSLRLAVEAGWRRARLTILAADAVSFLAALVLYIFAIGVVRGFAFTLGLITIIDVFVVFFFTKPLVSLLARTQFFGRGHKLSGFDAKHLGISGRPVTQTGRRTREPSLARTTTRGEA